MIQNNVSAYEKTATIEIISEVSNTLYNEILSVLPIDKRTVENIRGVNEDLYLIALIVRDNQLIFLQQFSNDVLKNKEKELVFLSKKTKSIMREIKKENQNERERALL